MGHAVWKQEVKHGDMVSLKGRRHGPPDAAVAARGRVEWGVVRSAAAPTSARSSLSFPSPGLCAWFALG